jgi:hypothetical protein
MVQLKWPSGLIEAERTVAFGGAIVAGTLRDMGSRNPSERDGKKR